MLLLHLIAGTWSSKHVDQGGVNASEEGRHYAEKNPPNLSDRQQKL